LIWGAKSGQYYVIGGESLQLRTISSINDRIGRTDIFLRKDRRWDQGSYGYNKQSLETMNVYLR
jgi:hypothetical protein